MKKNMSKKPNLDEYDNQEDKPLGPQYIGNGTFMKDVSAGELMELIENYIENVPDKRTHLYKRWRHITNNMIDYFNENFREIYKRV